VAIPPGPLDFILESRNFCSQADDLGLEVSDLLIDTVLVSRAIGLTGLRHPLIMPHSGIVANTRLG